MEFKWPLSRKSSQASFWSMPEEHAGVCRQQFLFLWVSVMETTARSLLGWPIGILEPEPSSWTPYQPPSTSTTLGTLSFYPVHRDHYYNPRSSPPPTGSPIKVTFLSSPLPAPLRILFTYFYLSGCTESQVCRGLSLVVAWGSGSLIWDQIQALLTGYQGRPLTTYFRGLATITNLPASLLSESSSTKAMLSTPLTPSHPSTQ